MTTERIDVLDIMQRASLRIAELSHGCKTATEAELQEARAAVAELIEAGNDYRDCLTSHSWNNANPQRRAELVARYAPDPGTRPMRASEARWIDALARVGGAS